MLLGRISRAKIMSDLANFFAGQELANSTEQSCSPLRYLLKTKTQILRLLRSEHLFSWDVLEKIKFCTVLN